MMAHGAIQALVRYKIEAQISLIQDVLAEKDLRVSLDHGDITARVTPKQYTSNYLKVILGANHGSWLISSENRDLSALFTFSYVSI